VIKKIIFTALGIALAKVLAPRFGIAA